MNISEVNHQRAKCLEVDFDTFELFGQCAEFSNFGETLPDRLETKDARVNFSLTVAQAQTRPDQCDFV